MLRVQLETAMIPLHHRIWPAIAALTAFAAGPDFNAVTWLPLGCDSPDLISSASPAAVSFVGDQTNLPAFYAYDSNYLYSRYRMDADPRQGATTRKQ